MVDVAPLFEPLKIKGIELANRFVMPAMQRGFARACMPTPEMGAYLRACAEGGMGLVITEGAGPDHPSAYWQGVFCILGRETRDAWQDVVSQAHAGGAAVVMQLWHVGGCRVLADHSPFERRPALSPSGLVQQGRANGKAMSAADLEEVKDAFVQSALIAQDIGADGVEVHCCHGYLLDQFLWSQTNVRTDEYGGDSLAARARYPMEIVAAIRDKVGDDFLISARFSQWKEVDYTARVAETPEALASFITGMRKAGIDLFNVSTRRFGKAEWPQVHPTRSLAAWVKTMTDAPVMAVGGFGLTKDVAADLFDNEDPQLQIEADLSAAVDGLENGDFDLIGVGRATIANNDLVKKIRAGELGSLVPFNKAVHLASMMAAFAEEAGLASQSRNSAPSD